MGDCFFDCRICPFFMTRLMLSLDYLRYMRAHSISKRVSVDFPSFPPYAVTTRRRENVPESAERFAGKNAIVSCSCMRPPMPKAKREKEEEQ